MSRWTFYTAPGTCALATHIALHEAGAEFDLVKLDIAAGQQNPDYLRVNPKGPRARTGHAPGRADRNPALLAFVAQSFPAAGLAPLDDPPSRACRTGQLPGLDRPRRPRPQAPRRAGPTIPPPMKPCAPRCRRP